MKLRIAICDDEQQYIDYLHTILLSWAEQNGHHCEILDFLSAEAFLFAYEADKVFDILLLDIEMKEISGIDLAKRIRKDNIRIEIIFITSHFEFYGEGYDVDALHYLLKPISRQKLDWVLTKAVQKLSIEPAYVIITCNGEVVKVYETEILYVEAFLHYILIVTHKKEYKIKESMSVFEAKLSNGFYRIHRSYLVSLKYVTRISRKSVWIDNRIELPLSRGKYDDIHYAFIKYN